MTQFVWCNIRYTIIIAIYAPTLTITELPGRPKNTLVGVQRVNAVDFLTIQKHACISRLGKVTCGKFIFTAGRDTFGINGTSYMYIIIVNIAPFEAHQLASTHAGDHVKTICVDKTVLTNGAVIGGFVILYEEQKRDD